MKKCPGCTMEIDKYALACQYCVRLLNRERRDGVKHDFGSDLSVRTTPEKENGK